MGLLWPSSRPWTTAFQTPTVGDYVPAKSNGKPLGLLGDSSLPYSVKSDQTYLQQPQNLDGILPSGSESRSSQSSGNTTKTTIPKPTVGNNSIPLGIPSVPESLLRL
ncbi:hypothetical protein DSO57_1030472 [Entomophthora muscae]|uniref:Uncharacterized protein n=1 Tax=Entomophthora muscae TaxID=34485 RepID=A0ACC2TP14_9FUNG|nr:hypothetical protein DSO57_1030472 [Entomophthora muscae]